MCCNHSRTLCPGNAKRLLLDEESPLRPLLPDDPCRFHQRKAAAAPATTSSTGKLVCGSFTTISTGFSLRNTELLRLDKNKANLAAWAWGAVFYLSFRLAARWMTLWSELAWTVAPAAAMQKPGTALLRARAPKFGSAFSHRRGSQVRLHLRPADRPCECSARYRTF